MLEATPGPIRPGNAVLEYNSHTIVLPSGEVLVGRGAGCFLHIDDPAVSRVHFRLIVGEKIVIEDAGSTNGTLVNGRRLEGERELRHGDEIVVGARTFRISLRAEAAYEFECDAKTPVRQPGHPQRTGGTPVRQPGHPQRTGGTLQGVGPVAKEPRPEPVPELEQWCPRCGEPVPFNAVACPGCGTAWPRGRQGAATDRNNPAVAKVRRHQRYAVHIGVRYTSESLEVSGIASNLSESGVFIATTEVDSVGTACRLTFVPAEGQRTSIDGFVRHAIHRGARGMGIEFSGVDEPKECWIRERLESWWSRGEVD
jgi:hypothetical protein